MAKEKLSMVTLSGPRDMVDEALQSCVINRDFHLENAIDSMSGIKRLYPFETENPYSETLARAYQVLQEVGIEPGYADFDGRDYTAKNTEEFFTREYELMQRLKHEREELRERKRVDEQIHAQLQYMQDIDVNLSELLHMKYVKFRFGRVPLENYGDIEARVDHSHDVFFIRTGKADRWVYGMYLALPGTGPHVDSLFRSVGFERIHIQDSAMFEGTSHEAERMLCEDEAAIEEKVRQLDELKAMHRHDDESELLSRYSYIRFLSESYDLRSYAGYRHGAFYIMGWIPAGEAVEYARHCQSIPGFDCVLSSPGDTNLKDPPTKRKLLFFSEVFAPFLEMYGLPSYGEIDPTLFMAITYTVIFGIMFGDIGQGIVLSLAGFLMWRYKKMWMGRILVCLGGSAAVFGIVYGSVFGFEHILPGFKVMEDGNAMNILMVSVAVGAVLILTCMVFNIINGAKQKDFKKMLFSPNGAAGILFYGGVVLGAVLTIVTGKSVFKAPYVIIFIVFPLFCIFASEPLTKLCEGRSDWLPDSIGSFAVEGFFELFETMLAYVSNTISFLRIGAFTISHAGMMSVVFMLAGGGTNVIGLIIGNIIVMGIEAVLVCIQVMRLEFYEMFGRFYQDSGKSFSPKIIRYDRQIQS